MVKALIDWPIGLLGRFVGHKTAKQFIKFCLVGTLNTGVDFGIYLALTRLTDFWYQNLVWASVVSFSAAVLSSFVLNTFWTFRAGGQGWQRRVAPFFAVAIGGLVVNAGTVWLLLTLGIFDILAKVVATVFTLAWNFTLQKKWTFRLK
jgi:putative flippase GtrA